MKTEKLVYDGLQRCPYLEGRIARMPLYRQLRPLSLAEADRRFENEERRVGSCLYRTSCPTCTECRGIRVLVDAFRPSKSQRRVRNRWKAKDFRIEYGPASWSEQKLTLFNKHKQQRGLAESADGEMSALGYVSWLVQSCFHTMEMRYFLGDRLVGVGIVDIGRQGMSSVYFYFDPADEIAALSPGVFSVLQEIELCRRTGRQYLYLGLFVDACGHLNYKANYLPHERMEDGHWARYPEQPLQGESGAVAPVGK